MTDLAAIADALAETISGFDAEVYARVPGSAITPALVCFPKTPITIRTTFEGTEVQFAVWCLLNTNDIDSSQDSLLEWISVGTAESIPDLIESDITLGGQVSSARVTEASIYGIAPWLNGQSYFQAELTVDILT